MIRYEWVMELQDFTSVACDLSCKGGIIAETLVTAGIITVIMVALVVISIRMGKWLEKTVGGDQ